MIFFVDGFSPFDKPSKNVHLWPIAGRIICDNIKTKPFVIALWCGERKEPECIDDFLGPFVEEVCVLMNGFVLNGVMYKLKIHNAIADAPARALIKKTNPPQSRVGCERCEIRGNWVGNRMTYPLCKCKARTDESFKARADREYHKGERTASPLEKNHEHDLSVLFGASSSC